MLTNISNMSNFDWYFAGLLWISLLAFFVFGCKFIS